MRNVHTARCGAPFSGATLAERTAVTKGLMYNVSKQTILTRLAQIGKVKKLDKWIPHELTDAQKEPRLDACLSLLSRNKAEPFLNQIVTCDEKWIMYDNRKRSSQWLGSLFRGLAQVSSTTAL